jgi:antibiotic biosynthesis monooxygenase (ABM) superfamily enzyme
MPEIVAGAGHATFINTFRCAPENQKTVMQLNVDIAQRVAREFPGFISATVHRTAWTAPA